MDSSASLTAFRTFDFDGDERWQKYKMNLEIPPGRESALQKFKAKWYKREIDPDFDISQALDTAASTQAPPQASSAHTAPPDSSGKGSSRQSVPRSPSQAASPPTRPTSSAGRQASTGKGKTAITERNLFILHMLQLALGLGAAQPLFWLLSLRCWKLFLAVSALCHLYKVIIKHGAPRFRPFPAALKQWAFPATASTDFQYLLLSALFLQARPMALVIVPVWILALYHAVAYAGSRFGSTQLWQQYGVRLQQVLSAYQGQALVFNAAAEVGVGFFLLLALLTPQRSILLSFVYWKNFLPARYHTPDAAGYHRQVWGMIADKTRPVLQAVPMLRVPIDFVKRAFDNPR